MGVVCIRRLHISDPRLPLEGFKKSGCFAGFGSACKERKAEHFANGAGETKSGKSSQVSKPQGAKANAFAPELRPSVVSD
jgi:hypothetical protein